MKRNKSAVWNVLHHYLPELVEGLSCEDVMKICGILDANSFRIDKYGTRSIFLATSMVKKVFTYNLHCGALWFDRKFADLGARTAISCDFRFLLQVLPKYLRAFFFNSSNPSNQFLTPVNLTREKTRGIFENWFSPLTYLHLCY